MGTILLRTSRSGPGSARAHAVATAWLLALIISGWLAAGQGALAQEPPRSHALERAFPHLSFQRMTHLTHAGDGTGRLWAVLQPGRVMVFPNDAEISSAGLFLDIRDRVNDAGNEEGLLGLAFDPDYARNGYLYVSYTASPPRRSVLSRFAVSPEDPDQADPATELVLLEVEQPFSNHNGGHIAFGPDGFLYLGLGDGGAGGDPRGNAQDPSTLLGAILRIDVRDATQEQPYRVPLDNPLVSRSGARGEVWAYGLRNPWKFAFDPVTDELWVADVGQNRYEEVNLVRPGLNYGWNVLEGLHCYPSGEACDSTDMEPPLREYGHDQGCSVTGGYVYRATRLPELSGAYLYGDFCSGRIWAVRAVDGVVIDHGLVVDSGLRIPSFGIDEAGEVYVLAHDGGIYRFVAPKPRTPTPTAGRAASPTLADDVAGGPSPSPGAAAGPSPLLTVAGAALAVVVMAGFLALLFRRRHHS